MRTHQLPNCRRARIPGALAAKEGQLSLSKKTMPRSQIERTPESSAISLQNRFQTARYASLPAISKKLAIPLAQLRDCARLFPVSWPCHYLSLVQHHDDPLARMGKPELSESFPDPHDIHALSTFKS